ncbi:hypothetical protein MUP65_02270 [Patescibacteria group bacterium]|nr:hypothetical protein [Patescibacteria group bacterium]
MKIKKSGPRLFLFLALVFILILVLRFGLGGDEDDWLCVDGQWVKHGNPSRPAPDTVCERSSEEEKFIGGETDEHGCLMAAGYSWCEPKEKCLRTWEEPCE